MRRVVLRLNVVINELRGVGGILKTKGQSKKQNGFCLYFHFPFALTGRQSVVLPPKDTSTELFLF